MPGPRQHRNMASDGILTEVENKLKEINIESSENKIPLTDDKSKKSKKKNKSKSSKNVENQENVVTEEPVDKENQENSAEAEMEGPVCAFCKKLEAKKRCSKRHPKFLTKFFCNETCEALAHENKKAAVVKVDAKKVAAAKKKAGAKVKNWKNTDSGQFWWHDQ